MRILGIETSCDETAISLIEANGDFGAGFHFRVIGDMTLSQAALHAEFGGVYPNLAKREHAKNLVPILTAVLKEAGLLQTGSPTPLTPEQAASLGALFSHEQGLFDAMSSFFATYEKPEIDAIAVTAGPGLEPALWVGINGARALAETWDIPLVSANHMEGHIIISSILGDTFGALRFPAIALLVSGGHTEIISMPGWMQYEKIGETRDDAIGEAFDKVARLLGLPYPGGAELSRIAAEARGTSVPALSLRLPRPMIGTDDMDFSFSGIKTAVRTLIDGRILGDEEKFQIAREFEDAVTDVLVTKIRTALAKTDAKSLIVGGGVSANSYIRAALKTLLESEFPDTALLLPLQERATDNALMIALAGYFHALKRDYAAPSSVSAQGTRQLS
jgi:N6-L-threonylcarbamoyladenine synthase